MPQARKSITASIPKPQLPAGFDAFCEAMAGGGLSHAAFPLALLAAALPFPQCDRPAQPHHIRRIEKLYFSTDLSAKPEARASSEIQPTAAISDWRADCAPGQIY